MNFKQTNLHRDHLAQIHILELKPTKDVDVLAVLDFQCPCSCRETPGFDHQMFVYNAIPN